MTHHYEGSCHCGAVRFSYDGDEITQGLRCTCSICRRKGALMSPEAIPVTDLKIDADPADLGLYEFDSKIAKHYFCRHCGIYTHNVTARFPDKCRVNLGCIDDLDTDGFEVLVFDGKNLL
ncbi:MAG: GFA family protein [Gammaproteobacteria bacterium]|nr:GFA family protein [Gammaproteobacteria bacterium]MDH3534237.1 GFA family protein [Gammaproteobacteria bacterium]